MASPPVESKRISFQAFLFVVMGTSLFIAWLAFQVVQLSGRQYPPELQSIEKTLRAGDEMRARATMNRLLKANSKAPEFYIAVMAQSNAARRFDLSREYGNRGLESLKYEPESARALLYAAMAQTYLEEGDPSQKEKALWHSQRAVEFDSKSPEVLSLRGDVLAEYATNLDEVDEAIRHIKQGLDNLVGRVEPVPMMGAAGISGINLALRTLFIKESYAWAYHKRGKFHAPDYTVAADMYSDIMADLPDEVPTSISKLIFYHAAVANKDAGRLERAKQAIDIALSLDPQYAAALAVQTELKATAQRQMETPAVAKPTGTSTSPSPLVQANPTASKGTPSGTAPVFTPLDTKTSKPSR